MDGFSPSECTHSWVSDDQSAEPELMICLQYSLDIITDFKL